MSKIRDYRRNFGNLPMDDTELALLSRFSITRDDIEHLPQRNSSRSQTHAHLNQTLNNGNILLALNRCCDDAGHVSWSQLLSILASVMLKTKRLKAIFIDHVKLMICQMAKADLIRLIWKSDQIKTIIIQKEGYKKIIAAAKFSNFTNLLPV